MLTLNEPSSLLDLLFRGSESKGNPRAGGEGWAEAGFPKTTSWPLREGFPFS